MEFDTSLMCAAIWLSSVVIGIVTYALRLARTSDYDFWESALYLPTYLMGRLLWRVYFTNQAPPELKAGALLVANHRSSVDPCFVQLAARRRVHWMVAREYCEHPVFGVILRWAQAIPTNRSGMDTAATKAAIRLTKSGRLVGMFPEGRLNHTSAPMVSIRSGAAMVAERAGVPIVPLYIAGSPYRREVWSPLIMPAKVAITFGTPIFPSNSLADSATVGECEPAASENGEMISSDEDDSGSTSAEALILQWGQQVVTLSGHPEFKVELASKRKRRTRAKS
jgi:1-acyl-sn-glycerol-3-phosphate acyltransferase